MISPSLRRISVTTGLGLAIGLENESVMSEATFSRVITRMGNCRDRAFRVILKRCDIRCDISVIYPVTCKTQVFGPDIIFRGKEHACSQILSCSSGGRRENKWKLDFSIVIYARRPLALHVLHQSRTGQTLVLGYLRHVGLKFQALFPLIQVVSDTQRYKNELCTPIHKDIRFRECSVDMSLKYIVTWYVMGRHSTRVASSLTSWSQHLSLLQIYVENESLLWKTRTPLQSIYCY